ncbi:unnamed protein product [Nesidiocoris tenuis]|uniref:Uncharacterized protein n=1 Tax=Nesidiocoris tenuis TaxID=355587 RepID=A0A6H5GGT1_9HEMI|nr:unnamed protein product [Nesidiocoris tenuis]
MFEIRFIRRMIRRRMTPIDQTVAEKWKRRLAIAYGVLAWNLFGVIVYNCYDGKRDWPLYYGLKSEEEAQVTNREYFARHLGKYENQIISITFTRE